MNEALLDQVRDMSDGESATPKIGLPLPREAEDGAVAEVINTLLVWCDFSDCRSLAFDSFTDALGNHWLTLEYEANDTETQSQKDSEED